MIADMGRENTLTTVDIMKIARARMVSGCEVAIKLEIDAEQTTDTDRATHCTGTEKCEPLGCVENRFNLAWLTLSAPASTSGSR